MSFNFGSIAQHNAEVSGGRYLRPWNIYENVKFEGIGEAKSGTSANGTQWTSYPFTFSCEEGSFTKNLFDPTLSANGGKRGTYTNKAGHEAEMPSQFEQAMEFVAQVVKAFGGEEKFATLQKISPKIKSFDELLNYVTKLTANSEITTKMKLVAQRNTTYADIPNLLGINGKTKETFTSDLFVGDKVEFTEFDLRKKKEFETSKPTDVAKKAAPASMSHGSEDEVSATDLLAGIEGL